MVADIFDDFQWHSSDLPPPPPPPTTMGRERGGEEEGGNLIPSHLPCLLSSSLLLLLILFGNIRERGYMISAESHSIRDTITSAVGELTRSK